MPIHAITGTPGAGKTLKALQTALQMVGVRDQSSPEAIREGLRKATRPLVVCGVEGLVPGLFVEMDDPANWQDFEDGTVFLVDEAWKWWGAHIKGAHAEPAVLALAEHRHRGMDFVLTCQMPAQLLTHVRGLVGAHTHVTRKFGTNQTVVREWGSLIANPNSGAAHKLAEEKLWAHPKEIFSLYQSATMHTIKRKIPLKVMLIPVMILVVLGCLGAAGVAVANFGSNSVEADAGAAVGEQATDSGALDGGKRKDLTPEQWADQFEPRIAGIPQSAPAYDKREVKAVPRVFCMSSGAGLDALGEHREASVSCFTEQGTTYRMEQGAARRHARMGEAYDHFREPDKGRVDHAERSREAQDTPTPYFGGVIDAPQVTGYGDVPRAERFEAAADHGFSGG